jgi:type IV fimbrial biogenesis protein FimT
MDDWHMLIAPLHPHRPCASKRTTTTLIERGFTLIELLVVISITAILTSLAAPSFIGLITNNAISAAVNNFIADTRYARGRSNNPMNASPTCSNGDGLAVGGWMEGWVVFMDINSDGNFTNGIDTVLRVQEPLTKVGDFYAVGATTISAVTTGNQITYDASGRAIGQQGRWIVHASGSLQSDATYARTLCLNSVGRVRTYKGEPQC